MDIGERLRIYKGILKNRENSFDTRWKLVRVFGKHGANNQFYSGIRTDNMAFDRFSDGEEINLDEIQYTADDIKRRTTIFVSIIDGRYFCDLLDNYRVCKLVQSDDYSVRHGCSEIKKIGPSEFVKFKSNK